MLTFEEQIKEVVKKELELYSKEIIEKLTLDFQKSLASKSEEIISKIVQYVAVESQDDIMSMRKLIQISMPKIVITCSGK